MSRIIASQQKQLKTILFNNNHPLIFVPFFHKSSLHHLTTSPYFLCKVVGKRSAHGSLCEMGRSVGGCGRLEVRLCICSSQIRNMAHEAKGPVINDPNNGAAVDGNANGNGNEKVKRKKLKGKRAVVRWLKHFRWKKKKEYERMTAEEKILYKLRKARNKEARLMESLKKIEPPDSSEATHDPEILTPEEHFYFLKMGLKCKNYVPIGRRGIYQGVILNMHLHWKKHQTLQVIVKTFTPEEVKEIAAELARLSGGIVLDIHEENTIIMYRGKNYSQPPTEIMSPKITLGRKKALDKSKYRDGLRALRRFIPRLEQDLELLKAQAVRKETKPEVAIESHETDTGSGNYGENSNQWMESSSDNLGKIMTRNEELYDKDSTTAESDIMSDSEEALSDIFETDSDGEEEAAGVKERPLYLDEFERFPTECDGDPEDFEEHLRQISADSKNAGQTGKDLELPDLDEVDRMFLRAGSLLKKKRK
ncbi:RNA-binding [Macleaya cordata]|uniref:RNA-binding n=1 Tax=Macleaya cordata TaxID=56857 RepID=A0A200QKL1_MACCD|nr:RNA-binding [Macleaya cordata]